MQHPVTKKHFFANNVCVLVCVTAGAFEGAWGTITWTYGEPNGKYSFDIYIPKVRVPGWVSQDMCF